MAVSLTGALWPQQPLEKKEKRKMIKLEGRIRDRLTTKEVYGAFLTIMTSDSVVVDTITCGNVWWTFKAGGYGRDSVSNYYKEVPKINGDYILKFTHEGYEPEFKRISLAGVGTRKIEMKVPDIYMSPVRKAVDLDEFVVEATKIKIYNKGDTVVFNADAFNLPEGSMLDALISQMPGVEIKDGGQIYVNGKYVESLLMNGKEFMSGNKEVMMQNIGAYKVKDVAVYDKTKDIAKITGSISEDDKEYVMDVRLKKDYMTGNMVKVRGGYGYGKENYYSGNLFAMNYTNNSNISIYANGNNVNDTDRPTNAEFSSGSYIDGTGSFLNGGLDYSVDNPLHTWEVSGNVDVKYQDRLNTSDTYKLNFLSGGDTYDVSFNKNRSNNLSVFTRHKYKINKDRWNLGITPRFSYGKQKSHGETSAASFKGEQEGVDKTVIKDLFNNPDNGLYLKKLVNKEQNETSASSYKTISNLFIESGAKMPGSSDAVAAWFETEYDRNTNFGNTCRNIVYGSEIVDGKYMPAMNSLYSQLTAGRPQYDFMIKGSGRYYWNFSWGQLNIGYEFKHKENRMNTEMMLKESILEGGFASLDDVPAYIISPENTYSSKSYTNIHMIKPVWQYNKKWGDMSLRINIAPELHLQRRNLFYNGTKAIDDNGEPSQIPYSVHLSKPELVIKMDRTYLDFKYSNGNIAVYYDLNTKLRNLIDLVDNVNTTDPLNVQEGNPNLKNGLSHDVYGYYNYNHNNWSVWANMNVNVTTNDLVRGFKYESTTGKRVSKMYNVNGNNSFNIYASGTKSFGKALCWSVRASMNYSMANSADLIGYDVNPIDNPQRVHRNSYGPGLSIRYEKKSFGAGINESLAFIDIDSQSVDVGNSNYQMYDTSAFFWYETEFGLKFMTRANCEIKRGYLEPSMNRAYFIWNANLIYKMKNGVEFGLYGVDLLNQRRGISYSVNAQGRTQTEVNVLPRYVMFTLGYSMDFKPKKR